MMGFLGKLLPFIFWRSVEFLVIFFVIAIVPWFPPEVKITSIELAPTKPVDPAMRKKFLNNADHIFTDRLIGAEGFVEHNGFLYTGLHGGEIVKISPTHQIYPVVKFGKPCEGSHQENICGRPLGFQIQGDFLYAADAYYGLWKVDLRSGEKTQLVGPDERFDRKLPKIFNSVAVAANGDIYWSHSSSDFNLYDGVYTLLADGSGRLFRYSQKDKTNKLILENLWFANGVALSPNEDFVLVSETAATRIGRFHLDGPKKGRGDVFADGLPGFPDNIRVLPDGSGILVTMYVPVDDPKIPVITRNLAPFSLIRKFMIKVLYMVEMTFWTLNEWYPLESLEKLIYKIGHFSSMGPFSPKSSYIGRYDWNGKLQELWYGDDESIYAASDAIVFNNKLYIGSPINNFIATVPVPESIKTAFQKKAAPPQATPTTKPVEEPKKAPKPEEVKPKPAEATPKPAEPKPKPAETKPKPTEAKPKPVEPKPTPELPKQNIPEPKVEVKRSQGAARTVEIIPNDEPIKKDEKKKTEEKKNEEKKAPKKATESQKKPTEPKPIVEDMKSDTPPPNKPTLKVIQKDGPAEIPNPGPNKIRND